MRFDLSVEQRELQAAVRGFLAGAAPLAELSSSLESGPGYSPGAWARIAAELELIGIAVPEADGGTGAGLFELSVVMSEMGRAMYAGPYFSTVLACVALLAAEDEEAKSDYLPGLLSGELLGTFVGAESGRAAPALGDDAVRARREGSGFVLDGELTHAIDGVAAGLLLLVAESEEGSDCFAVEAGAAGLGVSAQRSIDLTRPLARVHLEGVPARRIGHEAGRGVHERVLATALVCSAAEQVGGAEASLEMAVEYAGQRQQFGRPIGSFQAIKHLCADTYVIVEAAKSMSMYAAWAADAGTIDAETSAWLAKSSCSDAFSVAAKQAIQVYGGIGFTWEHPAHLYLRRATASRELFGPPSLHRAQIAAGLSRAERPVAEGVGG